MTFTVVMLIIAFLIIGIIVTVMSVVISSLVSLLSKNIVSEPMVRVLVAVLLFSTIFSLLKSNLVTNNSSRTYQLKLNGEGHTQYSVKSDQSTAYGKYKVTTIKNKVMTVDNPDSLVYNKTNKSKLIIKTKNVYLSLFGYKFKINSNETQTLYIIK